MVCNIFWLFSIILILAYNKNKLYKTLGYWSKDMLNFDFLEKGLGIWLWIYDMSMIFQEYTLLTDQI